LPIECPQSRCGEHISKFLDLLLLSSPHFRQGEWMVAFGSGPLRYRRAEGAELLSLPNLSVITSLCSARMLQERTCESQHAIPRSMTKGAQTKMLQPLQSRHGFHASIMWDDKLMKAQVNASQPCLVMRCFASAHDLWCACSYSRCTSLAGSSAAWSTKVVPVTASVRSDVEIETAHRAGARAGRAVLSSCRMCSRPRIARRPYRARNNAGASRRTVPNGGVADSLDEAKAAFRAAESAIAEKS
jgi:hypothetical protein